MADDANDRGWALLQRSPRSPADLEEALHCFEQAIGAGSLPAVANLANTLVALGRTDDAVAELDQLSRAEDALAARAHNWLGWHYQTHQLDLTRSIAHLERSTTIDHGYGVAWLNLAKAHDAGGDLQRAAVAYGKAIECGNSHDDAFARDRRLQLEMQLLLRGEPPPAPPATAAADSRAFEIVRETAARLPTAHAFMIRPTQLAGGSVMPPIIGTVVDGRALGACIVTARPHVLAREGDTLIFVESADLVPWLSALDASAVTPIDVAMWIFEKLREPDWSWRIAAQKPAAVALWPRNIAVQARAGGGVTVRCGRASFDVTTVAAALELEAPLRAAIAAEQARLHSWDLREGQRYRVIQPLPGLTDDQHVTLVRTEPYARGDFYKYMFEGDRGGKAMLDENGDASMLDNIDLYLARHP